MTTATARPRRARTRTRRVSPLPAVAISELPPQHVQLEPRVLIVCPDCHTWVPVVGVRVRRMVAHDTGRAGIDRRQTCRSSNRQVLVDLRPRLLRRRLAEATAATAHRQPTTVHRAPATPQPPAVTQIAPRPPAPRHRATLGAALRATRGELAAHRDHCARCQPRTPGQPARPCRLGQALEVRLRALQQRYVTAS